MPVSSAKARSSGAGGGPEDAVAGNDQRALRREPGSRSRARRCAGSRCRAEVVRPRRPSRRGVEPLSRAALVEDVRRDLDQRHALRRRRRLAEGLAEIDLDRRPVEHALHRLGEGAADLAAIGLLERAEPVLGGRVLAGDADDRAPGKSRRAKAGDGVGQAAAGGDAADAGRSGGPRPAVGGVGARLLVAHVDELHAMLAQRGEDRPGVAAVHREEIFHALRLEHPADQLAAVDLRRRRCPRMAPRHRPRAAAPAVLPMTTPDSASLALSVLRHRVSPPVLTRCRRSAYRSRSTRCRILPVAVLGISSSAMNEIDFGRL